MPRIRTFLLAALFSCALVWPQEPKHQEPAEEDEALGKKEYSFNPLQAEKELRIGNFYFRKGNFKAAAGRFREAARWNPNFPDAYLRLGEAEEKRKDPKAAREAFAKFLELAPQDKRASEVRKKLGDGLKPAPAR